ncbi:DUF3027 domain-containing protein [Arthrobacter sp. NPDC090010]|uniref:DUF3027 domain-containing protein n=1 Tax=Arthrobacter sp. NPDC090010 TaxID=3363942 RepID=UPI0038192271
MTVERRTVERPPAPRPGVPQWKTGKPDAVLAEAVDVARRELEAVTSADTIGGHLSAKREEDRVVTHLFESRLTGYTGWQWFAVLTRNSRSKTVTVSEVGLLPSEDSVLAPPWVPWSDRVRPEDITASQDEESGDAVPEAEASAEGEEPKEAVEADESASSDDEDATSELDES